ncbi:MAG TPA: lipopolysaccharide heptosyltransferase II [Bdellovibrionales bacterium]|nr:lipopolysaccharide heptosyltransferase II [Bdellovibrionales bacterium]
MSQAKLLKLLDKAIGKPLVLLLGLIKTSNEPSLEDIEQILVIRPGGIGDAVLLLPAIQKLKSLYPKVLIDVLAEKRNAEIFRLSPCVDGLFLYDRPKDLMRIARRSYNVIIDSEQWYRLSAVAARMIRARRRIGFGTNERGRLLSDRIHYSQDTSESQNFMQLLEPLNATQTQLVARSPVFNIPIGVSNSLKKLVHLDRHKQIVIIFPGSSNEQKRWHVSKFIKIAQKLIGKSCQVIIVGGKSDIPVGEAIAAGAQSSVHYCGRLSLAETAALLKDASLVISGDSGVMHMAAALDKKIVALFGPSNEKKWAPMGENHIVINKHLPCSPCTIFGHTPTCKKGAKCMELITPEEVFGKAVELLEWKADTFD